MAGAAEGVWLDSPSIPPNNVERAAHHRRRKRAQTDRRFECELLDENVLGAEVPFLFAPDDLSASAPSG